MQAKTVFAVRGAELRSVCASVVAGDVAQVA